MATKKTDNLFDDDFEFDDDIFGNMSSMNDGGGSNKKRKGPVRTFVSQFGMGAKETLLSPSLIRKLAIEILPKGYGSAIELADTLMETTRQLYDDAAAELKPALPAFRKSVGQVQGALEGRLPSKLNDILKEFSTPEETYRSPTAEEQDDQTITEGMAKIFEKSDSAAARRSSTDRAERILRQRVEDDQQRDLLQLLSVQSGSLSRLVNYQDKVTHPWRQKSLELQYRQTFYARDLLATQRETMGLLRDGFKDLVHNTSLPDYRKTDPNRRTDGSIRNRLGRSSNPASRFVSGMGDRIRKNLSEKVKGLAGGIGMGVEQIASLQDAIEGVDEDMSPGGRLGFIASALGGQALEFGAKKLARIPKRLMARAGRVNRNASFVDNWIKQAPENLQQWLNKDEDVLSFWGNVLQVGKDLFKSSPDLRTQVTESPILSADKPVPYDGLSRRSLVEIIPGFLARILQSTESIRSGFKFDQTAPLTKYNLDQGSFTTLKTAASRAKERLFDKNALYQLHRSLNDSTDFMDDGSLTQAQRRRFQKQLMVDTQNLVPMNERYFSEAELARRFSARDAKAIRKSFQRQFAGADGRFDPEKMSKMIDHTKEVQSNYIDPFEAVQAYVESGGREEMLELGLINDKGEIQRDRINEIILGNKGVEKKKKDERTFFSEFGKSANTWWEKKADAVADRIHDNSLYQKTTTKIGDMGGRAYDKVRGWVVGDVYDEENMDEPLITGEGIRRGDYFDQETGEVITKVSDINGSVIDRAGNVVATVEQLAHRSVIRGGKVAIAIRNRMGRVKQGINSQRRRASAAVRKARAEGRKAGDQARELQSRSPSNNVREPADVFVIGEMTEPVLYKVKMVKGLYANAANGSIVNSIDDIAGPVKDLESGNIVITKDDYRKKGLVDANGYKSRSRLGRAAGQLLGTAGRFIGAAMTVMTSPITAAKALAGYAASAAIAGVKRVFAGRTNPEQDLYVKGNLTEPALLWKKMMSGNYISARTGKIIRSVYDIDGEVVELNPNDGTKRTVLTEEEAAKPLVDYKGNKVGSIRGRIVHSFKSVGAGAVGMLGSAMGWGTGKLKGFFNVKGKPISAEEKNVEVNMSILEVLRERLIKPKKIRKGSYEEQLARRAEAEKEEQEKKEKDEKESKGGILGFFKGLFSKGKNGLMALLGLGGDDEDEDDETTASDVLGNVTDAALLGDALTGRRGQSRRTRSRLARKRLKRMRKSGHAPRAGKYGRLGRLGRGRAGRLLGRIPGLGRAGRGVARGATMLGRGASGALRGSARALGPLAAVALAGLSAKEAWDIGHDQTLTAGQRSEGVASSVGGAAGGLLGGIAAGAATGAALGTIFPGIGNLVGGVVGGVVGGIAGTAAGQWIGKKASQGWQGLKNRFKRDTNRDPLFKLRMAQYGINFDDRSTMKKIQKLEYGVQNKLFHSPEEVLDAMELNDGWFSSKGDQRKRFNDWLTNRFFPVYKAWVSAMKANQKSEDTDFDEASKLEKEPKKAFIESVYSGAASAYSAMLHPFTDGMLTEGPKEVEDAKNLAIADLDKTGLQRNLDTAKSWARKINSFIPGGGIVNRIMDKMDERSNKAEADRLRAQQEKDAKSGASKPTAVAGAAASATAAIPAKTIQVDRLPAMTCIRYKAYGLKELTNEKVEQFYKLENVMWATKVFKVESGKAVTCLISSEEAFSRYCNIFGYTPDEAPYRRVQWEGWFKNRFLPVMLSYVSGCVQVNPSLNPFKDIEKLKPSQQMEIVKAMMAATYSVFGFDFSIWRWADAPWVPGEPLNKDKSVCDGNILAIQNKVREEPVAETTATPKREAATPPQPPAPPPKRPSQPRPETPAAAAAGVRGTVTTDMSDPANSPDEATRRDAAYWRSQGLDPAAGNPRDTANAQVPSAPPGNARITGNETPVTGRLANVRGIRNNNPGNIDHSPRNNWVGILPRSQRNAVQAREPRFEIFSAPVYGIRAICRLLFTYYKRDGLNTVRKIITKWAPPEDKNYTNKYIDFVSRALSVSADTIINVFDFDVLRKLVIAIITKENGGQPYSSELINEGLRLAGVLGGSSANSAQVAPAETVAAPSVSGIPAADSGASVRADAGGGGSGSNAFSVPALLRAPSVESQMSYAPRTTAISDGYGTVPGLPITNRRTISNAGSMPKPLPGIGAPLRDLSPNSGRDVAPAAAAVNAQPKAPAKAVRAAAIARRRAQPESIHKCATYVRIALQSAGYKFNVWPVPACDYANDGTLSRIGFTKISNDAPSLPGDVRVTQRFPGNKWGHICIFDGRNWISDFVQKNGSNPYSKPRAFTTWRDLGGGAAPPAETEAPTGTSTASMGSIPPALAAPSMDIGNANGLAQASSTSGRDDAMYNAAVAQGYSMMQTAQRGQLEANVAQTTQTSMVDISREQLETQKAILEQTRRTADGVMALVSKAGAVVPAAGAAPQADGKPKPASRPTPANAAALGRAVSFLGDLQNNRPVWSPVSTARSRMASQGK